MNAIPVARSRPITGLASLWRSTIGKKYVMAITGLIWFGYLIVHLWGNLKIYAGPVFLNTYGDWLRIVGEPFFGYSQFLWMARIILIPAFVVHVWAAVQLTSQRPGQPSAPLLRCARTWNRPSPSRTMIYGGAVHPAVRDLPPARLHVRHGQSRASRRATSTTTSSPAFSAGRSVLFYELAMIAVGLHLFHGIWSTFQTLGWNTARTNRGVRNLATFFAVLLTVGNISIPLAVLTGVVK